MLVLERSIQPVVVGSKEVGIIISFKKIIIHTGRVVEKLLPKINHVFYCHVVIRGCCKQLLINVTLLYLDLL